MPLIVVTKSFKFAHRGYQVEEFLVSETPCETTDECAELAVNEGWAQRVAPAAKTKSRAAAPENKDGAPRRATKSPSDLADAMSDGSEGAPAAP